MKRFPKVLIAIVASALAIAVLFFLLSPGLNWQHLPDGAKTRVFAVTHGTKHRLEFPTRSWVAHYRKVFSRRFTFSLIPQFLQRERGGAGASSATPSTVIWFQSDTRGLVSFDATLVTADGNSYHTQAANGPTTDGYAYTGLKFPVVTSEPTLRLQATINGLPLQFEVSNRGVHNP